MGSNKMLIIFAAAGFLACVPYSQGISYVVLTTSQPNENRGCSTRFGIRSAGIDDFFHVSCLAGSTTRIYVDGDKLLIGNHRENRVSVYVEGPNSLVMISGNKQRKDCQRKTFDGGHVPSQLKMTDDECEKVKTQVDTATKGKTPLDSQNIVDHKEGCSGSITIIGEEIRYVDNSVTCLGVERTNVVFPPHGFVVSSYIKERPGEIIFSNKPRTMIRIKEDKTCDKIIAVESGKWNVDHSDGMRDNDCTNVLKEVEKYLGFTIYRYSFFRDNQCFQEIKISGGRVVEVLLVPCKEATKVRAAYWRGWFLLGNPKEIETSAFSDKAGSLVVVLGDNCTRNTNTEQGRVEQAVPPEECEKTRQLMTNSWAEIDRGSQSGKIKEFKITKRTQAKNDQGNCIQIIDFEGNGIKDYLEVSCESGARIKLSIIPNGFILCDYQRRHVCILTNSPKTLISVKNKKACDKTLYENGQEQKSVVSKEECDASRKLVQTAKAAASN